MLTFIFSIKSNLLLFIATLILSFVNPINIQSQNNTGKFELEVTKAKIGISMGPYRGRTDQTNGFFNQGIATIGQVYFPFQWVFDYDTNFSGSNPMINEYNKRIFLIRPSALFHVIDEGSIAFGLANQFSFLIIKNFYLEYQIAGIYLEAASKNHPDLNDGFNLHHTISMSKPLNRNFSISTSIVHFSSAQLGEGSSSNQDVLTLGIKWNL